MPLPPASRRVCLRLGHSAPGDGGLFEFSSQIGLRVAQAAPQWLERYGVRFSFAVVPSLQGFFGPAVEHVPLEPGPGQGVAPFAVWHALNQLNRHPAPPGCKLRMLTIHDLNYLYAKNAFSRWRDHRRLRALVARTEHIVAISQHTADDVRRHLGWTGPLEVIHNGARDLSAEPREPLPGMTSASPPFLLHLSRMSRSKNPQAIVDLARSWPEMEFVLCGPAGHDARRLRQTVHLPNVQFHLGISEAQKAWAYGHCAGFLFPSLTEGFGLPPIEAMHFGKPVFLARRTCLPEIGGAAADYFDDFAPLAMRAVIEQGLARHAQPGRAQAIREHAAQFDWDRAAGAYLDLYRRLLALPAA
jgi:glycosyltransferase involved in cell wall biosynthesis